MLQILDVIWDWVSVARYRTNAFGHLKGFGEGISRANQQTPTNRVPNLEKTLIITIKQKEISETTIKNINTTIDNMGKHNLFFIIKWFSWGKIVKENNIC